MFNLNENNRFVMSRNPMDLRKGVDSLCSAIRSCHLDPLNDDVYVFSNRSRTVLKLLHWERGGYTLYYKRLSVGRFHPKIFLRDGVGFRSMRWDELVLQMEGISPGVARRKRYLPTLNVCFGATSATSVSPKGRPCSMRSSTRRTNPRKPPLPPRCGKSGKRRRNAAPVPARSRCVPDKAAAMAMPSSSRTLAPKATAPTSILREAGPRKSRGRS